MPKSMDSTGPHPSPSSPFPLQTCQVQILLATPTSIPKSAILPHISAFYNTYQKSSSVLIISPHDLKLSVHPQSKNRIQTYVKLVRAFFILTFQQLPESKTTVHLFLSTVTLYSLFPTPSSLPKSSPILHGHPTVLYKCPKEVVLSHLILPNLCPLSLGILIRDRNPPQ